MTSSHSAAPASVPDGAAAEFVPAEPRFMAWPLPELHGSAAGDGHAPLVPAGPSAEETGYAAGFAEAQRLVRDEAQQRINTALKALAGATRSIEATREGFAAELEDNLYALAVALAQQIVEREVAADPVIVRDLVRRAVDVLPLDSALEIRLHPADLAALDGQLDVYANGERRMEVQWTPDPTIERGGYVVETPQRVVDGRVDEALRALYERLRDE